MDKITFYKDMIQLVKNTPHEKLPKRVFYLNWMEQQLSYLYRLKDLRTGKQKNEITIIGPVTLDLDN